VHKNENSEGLEVRKEERENITDFDFASVAKKYYTDEQYAQILKTRIGIAGAGGLGSNCAMQLVRCGFEDFTIVDFDIVEPSNLNRQAYFYRHIGKPKVECLAEMMHCVNPGCRVNAVQIRVDEGNIAGLFESCDAVVEAFDKAECKAMLAQAFMRSTKLVVGASGLGGVGDSDRIVTRAVTDLYFLIGDGTSEVGGVVKPYSPRVNVAASKQSDVVLAWALNHELPH
jgi:sulfur carrier protein ThiS adenylyltransferase